MNQKAKQKLLKFVKKESREFLKSASNQAGLSSERAINPPSFAAQETGMGSPKKEDLKKKEEELLALWRKRLREIQDEEKLLLEKRQKEYEEWSQKQEELIGKVDEEDKELIVPESKPKKGFPSAKGIKAKIKQKMAFRETGRGAKN